MSVLQVESFDQELKVLLVTQESSFSKKIVEYLYSQQIAVISSPLIHLNSSDFLNSLLQTNQVFKIVVVINFDQPFDLSLQENVKLFNFLKSVDIPKIFVVRVSSKIQSTEQMVKDWVRELEQEDYLIEEIINTFSKTKLLIGQDVTIINNGRTVQPYKTIFRAVPNGHLLDPQTSLYPITENDFFNNISKELLRPNTNNYLIRGSLIKSEELVFKFSLIYKQLFNASLFNLDIATSSPLLQRFECFENILEVVIPSNVEELAQLLVENINFGEMGLDPNILSKNLNNSAILNTQITKPFKKSGIDFQFEPTDIKEKNIVKKRDDENIKIISNSDLPKKDDFLRNSNRTKVEKTNKKTKNKNEVLDESITRIFSQSRTEQKTVRRSEKVNIISRIRKKSKNKQIIFLIGLVVFIFGVITAISVVGLALNYQTAQKQVVKNIISFNNKEYNDISELSMLGWQTDMLDKVFDIQLIEKSKELNKVNQLLVQTSSLSNALQLQSINVFKHIFNLNPQGEGKLLQKSDYYQLLTDHQELAENLSEHVSIFQAENKNINYQIFNSDIQSEAEKLDNNLRSINNKLQTSSQVNALLPDILGVSDTKTYYILLQDNQEIRPTGGFIQAVAQLSIDEGRLIDQNIYTTGWIDSKVLGDVASIPEVEEYLGEPRLHLRDANWDPDLSSSAAHISWFLKEAINQPIDGVIAINYDLLRELLTVFGEIYLEDYDETVNSSNLFSKLEQKAFEEKEQFAENNFHTEVLKEILNKVKNSSDKEILLVQEIFYESLKNQQSSLYFSSATINNSINKLGWAGSILEPTCPSRFSEECQTDFLYQVEANVGVNKVNQYVSSQVNHIIKIEQDRVFHERSIKYNNKSHSSVWPLGNYRSYIRFYLDKSALLDKLLINGGEIPRELIKEYDQHDRKVVGVLIDVPPGDEKNITLLYSTPHAIKEGGSYFFFEQPQSGIKNRINSILLTHPENLRPELISPLVEVNQNQVVVTSELGYGFIAVKFAE